MSAIRSLPLVVGIMGDFAGKPEEVEPIAERSFILIDANNFDDSLARLRPRVAFSVPNTLTGEGDLRVDLRFTRFADFARAGITNQVDALKKLESANVELLATMTWLRSLPSIGSHRVHARRGDSVGSMLRFFGAADREGEGNRTTILESMRGRYQVKDSSTEDVLVSTSLPPDFAPRSPFLRDLLRDLLERRATRREAIQDLQNICAEIQGKISEQVNQIVRNEELISLQAAWHSLHRLITTSNDQNVHFHVIHFSRSEIRDAPEIVRRWHFGHTQWKWHFGHALWTRTLEKQMRAWGGEPFMLLLNALDVGIKPIEIDLLRRFAAVASEFNALLIAAADPEMLDIDDFPQVDLIADLKTKLSRPELTEFLSFLRTREAGNSVIALPSFLVDPRYGDSPDSVALDGEGKEQLLPCNPAFLLTEALIKLFKAHPFCGERIRGIGGDGEIKNLCPEKPVGEQSDDAPPDVARLSDLQCMQLAELGFSPLRLQINGRSAAFATFRTLRESGDQNELSKPFIALEHKLVLNRLCHHIAHHLRETQGQFGSLNEAEKALNERFNDEILAFAGRASNTLLESVRIGLVSRQKGQITIDVHAYMNAVTMLNSAAWMTQSFVMQFPE